MKYKTRGIYKVITASPYDLLIVAVDTYNPFEVMFGIANFSSVKYDLFEIDDCFADKLNIILYLYNKILYEIL